MNTTPCVFKIHTFNQLSNTLLYDILTLRQKIFVVEQNCVYLDNDDLDKIAEHVTCYVNDVLVAYVRIISLHQHCDYIIIGRVVCDINFRGLSIGKQIMQYTIDYIGKRPIKIGAQSYLKKFYENLGFKQTGEEYDLDGIPHIDMIRKP